MLFFFFSRHARFGVSVIARADVFKETLLINSNFTIAETELSEVPAKLIQGVRTNKIRSH